MRTLTIAFVFSIARDPWLGPDKIRHFFMAGFVQSVAYSGLRTLDLKHDVSLTGATTVTAALSVGKEIHDHRAGYGFSTRDLAWDAAGAASATFLLVRTR